jgi:hypothetical protein
MSAVDATGSSPAPVLWPTVAMIAGGVLNIALWPVYTTLHGPGSFDRGGELLGMGTLVWGSMMEGPSGLLIALGLAGSYSRLTAGGTLARVGYVLAIIGVAIPALINVAILAVMPPLLAPVFGAGLILIAVGARRSGSLTRFGRLVLWALGTVLFWSFLWLLAVRPHVLDQIHGYRIYGLVANVLFGVGWVLFGLSLVNREGTAARGATAVAVTPRG